MMPLQQSSITPKITFAPSRQSESRMMTNSGPTGSSTDLASDAAAWQAFLVKIFNVISEIYDVPTNLRAKNLRVFVPEPADDPQLTVEHYDEMINFQV